VEAFGRQGRAIGRCECLRRPLTLLRLLPPCLTDPPPSLPGRSSSRRTLPTSSLTTRCAWRNGGNGTTAIYCLGVQGVRHAGGGRLRGGRACAWLRAAHAAGGGACAGGGKRDGDSRPGPATLTVDRAPAPVPADPPPHLGGHHQDRRVQGAASPGEGEGRAGQRHPASVCVARHGWACACMCIGKANCPALRHAWSVVCTVEL
jgi:hypothetical protein